MEKEKKFLIDNPTLMAEWNWEKNNELGLNPQILTITVPEKVLQIYLQDDNWKLLNVIN